MRVLLVTRFQVPHGGGLSSHVEDLILCLTEDGHEVKLIEGSLIKISIWHKLFNCLISCGRTNDTYLYRCLKISLSRLSKLIECLVMNNSFDIIHCHDPVAGYAVHQALHRSKRQIPVIETIHGPQAYEAKMSVGKEICESKYLQKLFEIEKKAFVEADKLIAVDTGQANIAINDFGINKNKISIIFNSVSCETIDSIIKNSLPVEITKPYLLVPRRLVKKTGVHVAIKAFAHLDSNIDVDLWIAGNGPLKRELQKLSEKLGISSHVKFLGSISREEVLRLAKNALAVIVPSIPSDGVVEATSLAVLEAMACGTAVIASNIGGLAELIQHNETGFLVPPNDYQSLSQIIRILICKPDFKEKICNQERQYVLQNLDTPIWLSKIKKVYEAARKTVDIENNFIDLKWH